MKLDELNPQLRQRVLEQVRRDDAEAAARRRANIPVANRIPDSESRERSEALAADRGGETSGAGCVHCCFTLVRKKLLDVDAKYASTKDLLDCLATAGIIQGDKEGEITLEVIQRKTEKGEAEFTEIEVTAQNRQSGVLKTGPKIITEHGVEQRWLVDAALDFVREHNIPATHKLTRAEMVDSMVQNTASKQLDPTILIDGWHRVARAVQLNLESIPAIVLPRELSEQFRLQ